MTEPMAPAVTARPEQAATADVPPDWWRHPAARAASLLQAEWVFVLALLAGALLRLCAVLGFRPIMWFNDGLEYLGVALRWQAYPVRPVGYSAFLRLLLPFHSFALVAALQHLMGLTVAVLLYALLRHWRVPGPLATLGVLPQLLDVHQVQLEHLPMSDTLFTFLLVISLVLLGWQRRATPLAAGAAGFALALAALTRSVGLPLVILGGIYLLIRWPGWRPLGAYALLALLPLGSFAAWYHHEHGSYAFGAADGVYLYSRVMVFADCAAIRPPADLAVLCPQRSQPRWPVSSDYIWHASPLYRLPGPRSIPPDPRQLFIPQRNGPALKFAVRAIESQPLPYLRVGLRDFVRSFGWSRQPYPNAPVVHNYSFSRRPYHIGPGRILYPRRDRRPGHDQLRARQRADPGDRALCRGDDRAAALHVPARAGAGRAAGHRPRRAARARTPRRTALAGTAAVGLRAGAAADPAVHRPVRLPVCAAGCPARRRRGRACRGHPGAALVGASSGRAAAAGSGWPGGRSGPVDGDAVNLARRKPVRRR